MKKIMFTTMLVAVVASGASASILGPKIDKQIADAFNPHKNGVIALSNGGYKSWKERRRACLSVKGEHIQTVYHSQTGDCYIHKYGGWVKTYYSPEKIPKVYK